MPGTISAEDRRRAGKDIIVRKLKRKLIILVVCLLGFGLLFSLLTRSGGGYDPTWIFIAAACLGVTFLLYHVLNRILPAGKAFSISAKVKVRAPLLFKKSGRYSLHVKITSAEVGKRKSELLRERELNIKLRKEDHPDLAAKFLEIIDDAIASEREQLLAANSGASIIVDNSYAKQLEVPSPQRDNDATDNHTDPEENER